jgi:hypothetical protein
MSRNKNGLIRKATCTECGTPTRTYRIVMQRTHEWHQKERAWLPVKVEKPVCLECMHKVKHLDTTLYIKNPELEIR